jgi:radical SAM superfamily enzyme YgiQ (UPF0313 family)
MSKNEDYPYWEVGPIRPPSEANSLLIRVTRNCPWNKCEFCPIYKQLQFEKRPVEDILKDIDSASRHGDRYETAFLQDANSLILETPDLVKVIASLKEKIPSIQRVTSYARARTVARKTVEELKQLHEAGLSRLHIGLESGYDALLEYMKKGVTSELTIEAGQKVKESGISLCFYVILGLGGHLKLEGKETWRMHALETARVLNAADPDYIRVRTLAIKKGMPLYEKLQRGKFEKASDAEVVREEELMIKNLKVTSHFVSDHSTNVLMNVKGKLPEDKEHMLSIIRKYLEMSGEEQLVCRLESLLMAFGHAPNYLIFNELYNPSNQKNLKSVVQDMEAKQPGSVRKLIDRLTMMLI